MSEPEIQEVKIYIITNRSTGKKSYQEALNAEDACKQTGWLIGDCFVREVKPRYEARGGDHSALVVKIPCQTCPYQYAECLKPPDQDCPCRLKTPDLGEWMREITKSHLCQFVGEELTKTDYHLGQKWLPIAQAIEELGDHR
ncbi:unnamed protein product [marine sediment metagenome]|uniref:Uncharacterized protein n=1 Tax=marine sediment metagenome TaxID=412755 RepID=X1RGF1_9ZZZZ